MNSNRNQAAYNQYEENDNHIEDDNNNEEDAQEDYDPNQGILGDEQEEDEDLNNQYNNSHNQHHNAHYQENVHNNESYRSEEAHVNPQQLSSIKEVIGKLKYTEARINNLKNDIQIKGTKVENKQKEVKDFSETLLAQIRQNPISRKPGLENDINHGVETAMVEAGATIQRLKIENGELKDIIKTKNQYIENIQENYRNMKKAFELKAKEVESLKALLEEKDHQLEQFKRKADNDYKVNAMRENIRAAKKEQGNNQRKEENYVDGIKDDYDFWKTANDTNDQEAERVKINNKNKLENMFQGNNKLFIQEKAPIKDINFDNLKLSPQQNH